ncbi:hypothetical protein AURDEDRAFT_113701 [Auricularia subglabra TFB-10046 SS5]|nr:hypothetical protein AURDEDRAFT_113701 [Auricularia subglabra TFB-10046 SS5]
MTDRAKLTTDQWLPLLMNALMRDIASVMAQSVLYGAYLVFFSFAIYQLLLRHKRQRAFVIVSATTLAMFVAGSFLWASNIAVLVQRLHIVFVEQDAPIADRITRANASTEKMRYMSDVMFIVSYLIGDAVIGWRILLLWQWKMWTTILMCVMWLATAATGFGLIGCLVNADFAASGDLPRACTHLENTSWLLSLVFNGTATALLARILWNRYKRNETTGMRRKNKVDRVLTVLVTSGIIYFILGLPRLTSFVNQTLNPLSSTTTYATQIIESMLYQLVNLYPTIVTSFLFAESGKLARDSKATVLEMTNMKGASRDTMAVSPTVGSPSSYGGSTAIAISVEKHSWMDEDRADEKA